MGVDASALLRAVEDLTREKAELLGDLFVAKAQAGTSRRTGELHDSIEAEPVVVHAAGASVHVVVGAEHGVWQNEGTGIYGPKGQRIEGNPLLAFDWPAAGGVVIVRSVAGSEGTHFWDKAIDAWPEIVAAAS